MKYKKTAFRRILSLFLVMALCITMQDMTAFAAETEETELKSETIEITGAERYDEEYYAEPALRFPVKQKKLYSQSRAELSLEEYVVAALENYETVIDVSAYNISSSEGSREYLRILNNNPQLFYVRAQISLSYMGNRVIYYQPNYLVGKEEAMQMKGELETAVQQALEQVEESMDAVQKALVVHDYLVQNCEYDQERLMAGYVPDISHTSYGALVNRMAVCDGYAEAYAYIMEHKLGIPCTVVSSESMNHAWNMIEIDGKWYHVDNTWDDPVWDCIGRVNHNYFLLSDQAISQDHYTWTQGYTADSDRYDREFWIGVESAISYYNGAWYYSGYESGDRKVVLKKREDLFTTNIETVYQTSTWQSLGQSFYTESFMYLAQANRKLYFNTSTEIMQMDADGDVQVFYEPDDLAGKQIFGFTVRGGEFLYAPNAVYSSGKQSDIRRYLWGETEPTAAPSQKPAEPTAEPGQKPGEPTAAPSQEPEPGEGVANLNYTFKGVDGTSVSTKSDAGQAAVIIFGSTTCGYTQRTMKSIAASAWVSRSDIRVIFAEIDGSSAKDVLSFATVYGCDDITFCYDEGDKIALAMWEYHDLIYGYADTVTLPVTVLVDGKNRIRHCLTGYQPADTIQGNLKEFVAGWPTATPGREPAKPSATPGRKPEQREIPPKNSVIRDTSGNTYQVTWSGSVNGTVAYVKANNNQAATVKVPSTVTIDNITYGVTSISAKAFRGNTKLKKVIIGQNVTSIGNSAFEGCTALKSIVIPSKVSSIGKNVFKNCKKLKSIRIKGNFLTKVGKNAFKGIHAKAKIKVPKKLLAAYKNQLKGKGQKKTVKIIK